MYRMRVCVCTTGVDEGLEVCVGPVGVHVCVCVSGCHICVWGAEVVTG